LSFLSQFVDHLGQLYLPGALALWCALIFSLTSLWGYSAALAGDPRGVAFGRRSYRFFALSIVFTAGILGVLLFQRDFRIEYIFQYSGMDLPAHYQLAAFWAGQKGSFLIWLFWASLLGVPLMKASGKRHEPTVMIVYLLTTLGLLLILVRENPFVMLTEAATDGKGLNPLLQDDWMVIHPPIMFIGFASTAVPFAFAMAALWRKDFSDWATRAFPWALGGFLVLGTAILMGGYWAYKTLGWGGYWGWDPVENASLIPWLLDTVLLHGLYMEKTRGRFRRANFVLAALAYLFVLYGTFLTRSGVLADFSVHSFVDLGISGLLIFKMVFFLALALFLLARLRYVKTRPNEDPILSRGSFLVLSTTAIMASAIVVALGTSAPLLTRFQENPSQASPSFYNTVNTPLALLIALLLAAIPFLTWKGVEPKALLKKMTPALVIGALVAAIATFVVVDEAHHFALIFLASAAVVSNLQGTVAKWRSGGPRMAGGYLAHIGVGVMLLGFLASSAYDKSAKVTLIQGETKEVNGMELTFTRFLNRTATEKERAEIRVQEPGKEAYFAFPKIFVNDRTRQLMVNPDIRKHLTADLYISPLEFDPGRPAGTPLQIQLSKGESEDIGGGTLSFTDFDLGVDGNALAAMEGGGLVTIGAVLSYEKGGETYEVVPWYRFNPQGQVQSVPRVLPGGGQVVVASINAAAGAVRLNLVGLGDDQGALPKLSVDVTKKPLINLVWWGFFIVLAGGVLAIGHRIRQLSLPVPPERAEAS